MTRPVWFVPVTFYLPADTPEDAACLIAEYIEDAAQAVLRSQGIVAVDVEAEKVGPCHDLFREADA